MKEALLYRRIKNNWVECRLCARRCKIPPGRRGFCNVRENKDGTLYTLVYGRVTAFNVDPIAKKPLFHVWPGAFVASISTTGCNFRCIFCDNWHLSQTSRLYGRPMSPEDIVTYAIKLGADGISYTYNEPTIFFEYMYDTAKLAKEKGLFNTIVTNGYMSAEATELFSKYLLAATVDFKGCANSDFYKKFCGVPDVEPIFELLLELKRHGVFIEITNLVVPEYGDKEEDLRRLARWIIDNLGPDIPFHLLRFFPDFRMTDHYVTPVEKLEKLYEVAKKEGLKYVYIGNVPGHRYENTYCPACGKLLISRYGFDIISYNLTSDNRCPECGEKVPIVGRFRGRRSPWWGMI